MKTLDAACRRILEAKYKLGLFDDPYKYCDLSRPARDIFTREHRDAARRIAAESFVLLKNEPFEGQGKKSSRPVLPLEKQGTVAVIGPLGNTRSNMPGTWSVAARLDDYPSLYEGLKEMTAGRVNITYAKGSNLIGDVAYEERATLFGRSLGRDNRTDKELLDEALKVASGADVIVAALGESSEMSGESSSRTDLDIPDVQRTLLEALLKTGKPVVLTLFTGRPLTLTWEQEHVPAILNVWFGGSEAAYAIGDVLFGDVNPSGKLTMTFPKNVGQIPLFYNHKNTGRPLAAGNWFEKFRSNYLDVDNEPLYPFGYGLSYTTFQYSDIALSTPVMGQNGSTTAVVTVTNTGKRDGAEVVQLYIRDVLSSITTYEKNLAGFQRIHLEPGEAQELSFTIDRKHLELLDADMKWVVEPGDFVLMAGASSEDIRLNGTLTVEDYQTRAKAIEAQKPAKRVSASTNPEDAENVLDEKINTAWQGNKGDYITFALKNGAKVDKVAIAFTRDNNLPATFEIQLSGGGGQFLTIYSGTVSEYGKLISYPFKGTTASDLRIVLNDDRVSIAEVKF